MKKLVVVLAVVILIIGGMLYIDAFHNSKQDNKYQEISKQHNQRLKELRSEKDKLEKELEELNKETETHKMSSTILLISDTKKECLNDAIKQMNDNSYHGVIVLDYDYLPDNYNEDYLNREDIDILVNKGYELVISIDKEDSPLEQHKLFNDLGYVIKGFYIENEITENQTDEIESIENMVIIGNIENKDEYNSTIITKVGLCNSTVKNTFIDSVNNSSILAICTGYENTESKYNKDTFNSMLSTISPYIQDEQTQITNITEAKQRHSEYQELLDNKDTKTEKRKQEINTRINEIEEELRGK